jgi:cytochrome b pre-mRNA-processing protein 3
MQASPRGASRHHRHLRDFVGFLRQIFGGKRQRARLAPMYAAVVAAARMPQFYAEGRVPDTIEGRFDMVASILSLVLLRLEREETDTRRESVLLTELFIEDMDGEIRQIGIGDLLVGKHVGRMMGALGGRIGAFRGALDQGGDLKPVVRRNIFHENPPSEASVEFVAMRLSDFREQLDQRPLEQLLKGGIGAP